jgi:enoyl-CoA hydratase/carnithine racemase
MCDLMSCAEEAIIFDPHYDMGSVPGDGIHSCLQELLGVKRAAYALITGQRMANNYAARPTGGSHDGRPS